MASQAHTQAHQSTGRNKLGREDQRQSTRSARLAQSVERQTLNLVVVGSSPTVGD